MVVKKDDRREAYDRAKVFGGIKKACEKRPVSIDTIEALTDRVSRRIQEDGAREVPSSRIGEAIMQELREIDTVAYVRFASVYRSFQDVGEFMREVQELSKAQPGKGRARENPARSAS